jgi:hypothetical protein
MTFLPIVHRELRVTARKTGTYRTRSLMAGAAVLVGAWFFGFSFGLNPEQIARFIFMGISAVGLIYGLVAGRRFTADCLSSEKREGTIGLLFLTDLTGYDVVFGKLAATSLSGLFGLLAIVPVLGMPMMMGGVSWQEVWRMALVLLNTFFFSLAAGIFVSALTRDARKAFGANFTLLLLVIAGPATLAGILFLTGPASGINTPEVIPTLLYSCPVYAAWLSLAPNYVAERAHFWWSVGLLHSLSWLLILLTCLIVPHCWQDRPAGLRRLRWKQWAKQWGYGSGHVREAFRKRLLDVNAFYWLAARLRAKPVMVWFFLAFMVIWWIYVSAKSGSYLMYEALVATAVILNTTFKLWVAVETGQRLGEDQSSGALELLLSTRLSVGDILRGQLLALQRQFLWPLVVVILVELGFTGALMKRFDMDAWRMLLTGFAGIVMLLADLVAVFCVAIASGLTSKNANLAIIKTISRILILPWLLFGAGVVVAWVISGLLGMLRLDWRFYLSLWFVAGILADIGFGVVACVKVCTKFRELAISLEESRSG